MSHHSSSSYLRVDTGYHAGVRRASAAAGVEAAALIAAACFTDISAAADRCGGAADVNALRTSSSPVEVASYDLMLRISRSGNAILKAQCCQKHQKCRGSKQLHEKRLMIGAEVREDCRELWKVKCEIRPRGSTMPRSANTERRGKLVACLGPEDSAFLFVLAHTTAGLSWPRRHAKPRSA